MNCDDMMKTWKLSGIYDEDKLKEAVLRARPDSPADIRSGSDSGHYDSFDFLKFQLGIEVLKYLV